MGAAGVAGLALGAFWWPAVWVGWVVGSLRDGLGVPPAAAGGNAAHYLLGNHSIGF
ncbi:hypothetical protein ACN4EG_21070 [Alkalinema pantanalense CENA528]|uniref:hypothetical protein n=1 Tax=Alkalinema pantanalense TaxID=1620705 RepID=UPI003D6F1F1B